MSNKKLRICFLENHWSVRGTTVAVGDYAEFNETILGNESFMLTRPYEMFAGRVDVDKKVYEKYEKRFKVRYYTDPRQIPQILSEEKADAVYVQKSGDPGDQLQDFQVCPTFVHAVFQPRCPHGDYYAGISEWLNIQYKTNIPVLPYITHLPETSEDLREQLNIPKDTVVFGRHGGYEAFDIPEAQRAVERVSREHPNIYFLMLHTQPFCSPRHNIIHLPRITDPIEKVKFINTCDAMVYARSDGETFGLAIGEFSIKNKPIFGICDYWKMESLMHKYILKDRAFWWKTEDELVEKMVAFTPEERDKAKLEDWNMYRDYSPENVMKIFDRMIREMLSR